jgi:DNA-binding HxlR family transcriptional regulator
MGSDDLFEAVSHPMRIEIVKALVEKPLRFADLKKALKISSSGLLDFHLIIFTLKTVVSVSIFTKN